MRTRRQVIGVTLITLIRHYARERTMSTKSPALAIAQGFWFLSVLKHWLSHTMIMNVIFDFSRQVEAVHLMLMTHFANIGTTSIREQHIRKH